MCMKANASVLSTIAKTALKSHLFYYFNVMLCSSSTFKYLLDKLYTYVQFSLSVCNDSE